MNHPQKRKKPKKGQAPEPVAMPLRDKLQIWAWIAGIFFILVVGFHLFATHQQGIGLDQLIDRWRHDYHLTDEQAGRIRGIEERFHGSGDPFTRPAHTQVETREHHRAIATVMNPEEGARFFHAQEGVDLPR